MKVLIIVGATTFFSFFFVSCKKNFLDVVPKDQLADVTFWKTANDAEIALTGIYNNWESYWNILWWDGMTDNAYSQFTSNQIVQMGNGQLNATNFGRQYFDYNQIRKCNNFLEKIDGITMNDEKKKQYIAEVRFLRAYDYFRKVEFYGDVPLVTKVIEDASMAKMARTSKDSVLSFILNELSEAAAILPIMNMRQSGGHVTRGSALALRARLELYEGMYADAMTDAKKVMDMGVYELYPDYQGQFIEDNEGQNKESVLEIEYIQDFYPNDIWQRNSPGMEGGWSSITANQSIVDSYEMANGKTIDDPSSGYDPQAPYKNRDPRLSMSILYPGAWFNGRYFNSLDPTSPDYHQTAVGPRTGYNVLKYYKKVPSSLFSNGGENVIVIRLAEVLLTYAEAAIELNQISDGVYDAIDLVRVRAGMPKVDRSVYSTQTELRGLVRRERRVELAFEGLRYWDIKRWDIGQVSLNGSLYGCREGSVNAQTGIVTWGNDQIKLEDKIFHPDRKYLLPIPQSELDANPNIKQNDGY